MINYFKNKQIGHQKGYGLSGVAGFTLVEILIVISIIATMATFAVTRLNPLRNKAKDTSIKISLAALRSVAEINYDTKQTYEYICDDQTLTEKTDSDAEIQVSDIRAKIVKQSPEGAITCKATSSTYSVYVPLLFDNAGGKKVFCVDSNGYSDELTVAPTTDTCK